MFENINLDLKLSREEYNKKLPKLQYDLRMLQEKMIKKEIALVVAFEGWDAAGKGGNIKRITAKLDPRYYQVHPVTKPSSEELARHYLWRFWLNIPQQKEIAIFDRTWYGRVLVERVEGFCSEKEWRQAYQEINQFEKQLYNTKTILIKFWVHISKEEQARRFEARKTNELKKWKITDEDWRNRNKWDDYKIAAEEMFQKTSTDYAPWHIIEGEDKLYGRIKTLQLLTKHIEKEMKK